MVIYKRVLPEICTLIIKIESCNSLVRIKGNLPLHVNMFFVSTWSIQAACQSNLSQHQATQSSVTKPKGFKPTLEKITGCCFGQTNQQLLRVGFFVLSIKIEIKISKSLINCCKLKFNSIITVFISIKPQATCAGLLCCVWMSSTLFCCDVVLSLHRF